MTRDEFEKRMVALLADAMKEGFLHRAVFMGSTREHEMMLTNMGQKATIQFMLHMGEHALSSNDRSGMVAYNLVTGEKHGPEEAEVSFTTGKMPPKEKGTNGRRKKPH